MWFSLEAKRPGTFLEHLVFAVAAAVTKWTWWRGKRAHNEHIWHMRAGDRTFDPALCFHVTNYDVHVARITDTSHFCQFSLPHLSGLGHPMGSLNAKTHSPAFILWLFIWNIFHFLEEKKSYLSSHLSTQTHENPTFKTHALFVSYVERIKQMEKALAKWKNAIERNNGLRLFLVEQRRADWHLNF